MSSRLPLFLTVLLAMPSAARGETEQYLGLGAIMIPVDGAAATATIEPGQFFESFSGSHYYFRVREGYEGDLISMGTPPPSDSSPLTSASMSESAADVAASPEDDAPLAVLGPYEIIGIYSYDTETGIDIGMDCENPTITVIGDPGDRLFRLDCPHAMQM
ncbi:MAG: hypothetical protein HKN64_00690 [Woeseiaceae bacterium]|nr:hypothetical protein [Woeseiaceae bacterium]